MDLGEPLEGYPKVEGISVTRFRPRAAHPVAAIPATAPEPAVPLGRPFRLTDPALIPPRVRLYGDRLVARYVSLTVSPGGLGKSSLALVEAVAIATGRPLLGVQPAAKMAVWYFNSEDGLEEIERRLAAICIQYGVTPEQFGDRLFIGSGRDTDLVLARITEAGPTIDAGASERMEAFIRDNDIRVVVLDPLVSIHRLPENDNTAIDLLVKHLNRIAERTMSAIEIVHHVRKGQAGQGEHTVEDGRGASALLAGVRSARVLNNMTKEEAEGLGLTSPRSYFRADNGKANLSPPPDRSDWFHLIGVDLGNGSDASPGDWIGVVTPWAWPDALSAVTVADLRAVQAAVAAGRFRANVQAKDWVGTAIATVLGKNLNDPAQKAGVRAMLKKWLETGALVQVTDKDEKGNERPFVEVGEWAI